MTVNRIIEDKELGPLFVRVKMCIRDRARYRMGMSLAEDSLLPEAIHYYRERKDSSRMLDGDVYKRQVYKNCIAAGRRT